MSIFTLLCDSTWLQMLSVQVSTPTTPLRFKHLEFFRNEVIKVDIKLVYNVCSQEIAIWFNIGMECKETFLLTNSCD